MAGEFFKNYYKKLAKEGFLKSFLFALTVGFIALFISAGLIWFIDPKLVWICPIVFVIVVVALTPLLYYKKFMPSEKYVAKRVDELGLEERMLTMVELEGNDSYIAKVQKEDALRALSEVNASFIKLVVTLPLILAVIISGVFGLSMTTVTALSAKEIVPPGNEVVGGEDPEDEIVEYEVLYTVDGGGGEIFGLTDDAGPFQIVEKGGSTLPVIAVADEGYFFVGWVYEDGSSVENDSMEPVRQDFDIQENTTILALFAEADEEGESDGDGDGSNADGDDSQNKPGSGQQKPGEGKPKPGQGPGAGGGAYEPNNNVIDGKTDYGDIFDDALSEALDEINADGSLTQEEKDIINGYIDNIRK